MRLLMPVCFDDINYYYKKNVEKNQNSVLLLFYVHKRMRMATLFRLDFPPPTSEVFLSFKNFKKKSLRTLLRKLKFDSN